MSDPALPDATLRREDAVAPPATGESREDAKPAQADATPSLPEAPPHAKRDRGRSLVRLAALVYVPVALGSVAWLVLRLGTAAAVLRLVGEHPLRDAALGLGAALMIVGLCRIASETMSHVKRAEQVLAERLGTLTTLQCLIVALASGLGEELLFRGVLQPGLGLVVTSILFGVVHVPTRKELAAWPVFAVAVGFLLGWIALRTGAVVAPIVAHVAINGLNLRFIVPRPAAPGVSA
jgi:membrane protease YdiL (CAAX protease family)